MAGSISVHVQKLDVHVQKLDIHLLNDGHTTSYTTAGKAQHLVVFAQ